MTRKSRPRIKEHKPKPGYCEICTADYLDASEHLKSPHHLAFVQNHNNFLSLDELIREGGDVSTFLDKATPINGERRSLRKMCNGDVEHPNTRSTRSQSPESPVNGTPPNGVDNEKRHNTRKRQSDDQQYYKVVGVNTKLRSSGGFKKKEVSTCNGEKPLVVKFRKVRKSELSVLSDEAEQFMFPKRASSTSSLSSDEGKEVPPAPLERGRLARPTALKEESSEEDSWPEKRRRKRRVSTIVRRTRPTRSYPIKTEPLSADEEFLPQELEETAIPPQEVNPLREEPAETCLKWEDGRLKYSPSVEQLEFSFESVPATEPWFEAFKRQDDDRIVVRNVAKYFAIYSKSPKLPYEMGQLPPLKPNCCSLSGSMREEKPGPCRSYSTRGNNTKKRTLATVIASEAHPRKSPREHASTLAILGSAGLLHRRKNDDNKSTASEDTISDQIKIDPPLSLVQQADNFTQFLSQVFDEAAEYEVPEEQMEGEVPVVTSSNAPDVMDLVQNCENCDIIRSQIDDHIASSKVRKSKKKKKKTRKKSKKNRDSSEEIQLKKVNNVIESRTSTDSAGTEDKEKSSISSDDRPLRLDVNFTLLQKKEKRESEKKKKIVDGWLQPVVRVSRVEVPRKLRSQTGTSRTR